MKTAAKNGVFQGRPCSASSVKKRISFRGIPICIDRPRGFVMKGTDNEGKSWTRKYKVNYGYIPKTLGGDGDGLDVFIGPDKSSDESYWAVQTLPNGKFDEYKVFLGFPNRDAAIGCYKQHIPKKFFSGLVTMKIEMMKAMLRINPKHALKKMAMLASYRDELEKIGTKNTAWVLNELKKYDPEQHIDPEIAEKLKKAPTRRGMRKLIADASKRLWKKGKEQAK